LSQFLQAHVLVDQYNIEGDDLMQSESVTRTKHFVKDVEWNSYLYLQSASANDQSMSKINRTENIPNHMAIYSGLNGNEFEFWWST
jgi:hypothetical protein